MLLLLIEINFYISKYLKLLSQPNRWKYTYFSNENEYLKEPFLCGLDFTELLSHKYPLKEDNNQQSF